MRRRASVWRLRFGFFRWSAVNLIAGDENSAIDLEVNVSCVVDAITALHFDLSIRWTLLKQFNQLGNFQRHMLDLMATFVLEDVTSIVHLIRESTSKDKKRVITTKCGTDVGRDDGLVTGWDSDVTCPKCAVPWV